MCPKIMREIVPTVGTIDTDLHEIGNRPRYIADSSIESDGALGHGVAVAGADTDN